MSGRLGDGEVAVGEAVRLRGRTAFRPSPSGRRRRIRPPPRASGEQRVGRGRGLRVGALAGFLHGARAPRSPRTAGRGCRSPAEASSIMPSSIQPSSCERARNTDLGVARPEDLRGTRGARCPAPCRPKGAGRAARAASASRALAAKLAETKARIASGVPASKAARSAFMRRALRRVRRLGARGPQESREAQKQREGGRVARLHAPVYAPALRGYAGRTVPASSQAFSFARMSSIRFFWTGSVVIDRALRSSRRRPSCRPWRRAPRRGCRSVFQELGWSLTFLRNRAIASSVLLLAEELVAEPR